MRRTVLLRRTLLGMAVLLSSCGNETGVTTDVPGEDLSEHPPACISPTDCNDQDSCTVDRCVAGQCDHVALDCDDKNPCTGDQCVGGTCVSNAIPGCCLRDTDCDDGDFCTPDRCSQQKCVSDAAVDGCCNVKETCDDGDECTYDDCIQHVCKHLVNTGAGCCEKDADCADQNACTEDRCVEGQCKYTNRGCCQTDADCTSEDPCERGTCGTNQKCTFVREKDCCSVAADCPEVICTTAACNAGKCERTNIERCCVKDEDCTEDCFECTIPFDQPRGDCTLKTTPECCTATLLSVAFSDLSGFTVEGLAGEGYAATPTWVVDSHRSASAPSSLYFGDPATHTFESATTMRVGGRAISPVLDLGRTLDPVLTFQLYKDADVTPATDILSVIVIAPGQAERTAWSSTTLIPPNTNKTWVPVTVNLAVFQGEAVQLVFQFDSMDVYASDYEGTYIDDVTVAGRCPL